MLESCVAEARSSGRELGCDSQGESGELTLRAEEVNTLKAYIDVNLNRKDGALPWLMLTGMLSAEALYKGIEGENWEEMFDSYKAMSEALGVKTAAGGPEGKSPVGHESSQGQNGRVY